jgi:cell division protein FtsL
MSRQRRARGTTVRPGGLRPVIRLRIALVAVCTVACAIAGPLLMVRKQVHLRNLAIRRERLADSLHVCNREVGELVLRVQALTAPQRIEHVARDRLGMDYPSPSRVVIVETRSQRPARAGRGILMLLRRALKQERNDG